MRQKLDATMTRSSIDPGRSGRIYAYRALVPAASTCCYLPHVDFFGALRDPGVIVA